MIGPTGLNRLISYPVSTRSLLADGRVRDETWELCIIAPPNLTYELYGRTDRGIQREANEDAFLVADLDTGALEATERSVRVASDRPLLVAVSDGMGGAKAGEVASRLSIEALLTAARDDRVDGDVPDPETSLRRDVERANDVVFERSTNDAACAGMGTTMTALLVQDASCYIAHVGDSRAYLLHDGALRRLTRDHSLRNFVVDHGLMSSEQADRHVNRHVILEALGVKEDVTVDTGMLSLAAGDVVLLCSDGLYSTMDDDELARRLGAAADLATIGDDLIDEANRRGGPDNITVVICRVGA